MKTDWRKPFREFKAQLRPLYDANLSIHHGVLLSTNRSEHELESVIGMLEPAHKNENLAKSLLVSTEGCKYHGHHFFADDRRGLEQLGRLLDGLEEWMDEVPNGLLPRINVPAVSSQTDRNLLRWVSIVYYLAWEVDEVYLQAELEHLQSIDQLPFLPWIECPQPKGCDPRPWVIHQGDSRGRVPACLTEFRENRLHFPDAITGYLIEGLIFSSLAALDLLIYRLPAESTEEISDESSLDTKTSKPHRKQGKNARMDLYVLCALLMTHHSEAKGIERTEPLTQDQIAEELGWLQPRVCRRMKLLFPGGMKDYRKAFIGGGLRRGFLRLLEDTSRQIEAVAEDEDGEDNADS